MFRIPLLEEDSEIKIIKNSYFEVSSNLNPPFIKFHRVQQNIVHVYISTPLQILCRVKMGRKNFIFHFSSRFFARTTIPPPLCLPATSKLRCMLMSWRELINKYVVGALTTGSLVNGEAEVGFPCFHSSRLSSTYFCRP